MYDKFTSPVEWYVGTYFLRFIELSDTKNDDLEERFDAWENTVIVKAKSFDEAYDKVTEIGKQSSKPYKGGADGVPVQWVFEGVSELLPIYEKLEDGAEIMYREHHAKKLKDIRQYVREKRELRE